jgi:hypothetical protein
MSADHIRLKTINYHYGSGQLLAIGTNGEWRSRRTHAVLVEFALLANKVHPCSFKSSDRNLLTLNTSALDSHATDVAIASLTKICSRARPKH